MQFGSLNAQAHDLRVAQWIEAGGAPIEKPLKLADLGDGYMIIYCFQHWCPGCRARGFPTLKYQSDNLKDKGFSFAVIQAVLEGSQINACSYCLILHTKAAHDQDIHPAKVAHLASWSESTMFSAAEQVALADCEGLTNYDLTGFAPLHPAMTEHFSAIEIAEIAAIVINMNLWTCLKLEQGATPVQDT